MKNKKALSPALATFLIILLALTAIVIILTFIQEEIRQQQETFKITKEECKTSYQNKISAQCYFDPETFHDSDDLQDFHNISFYEDDYNNVIKQGWDCKIVEEYKLYFESCEQVEVEEIEYEIELGLSKMTKECQRELDDCVNKIPEELTGKHEWSVKLSECGFNADICMDKYSYISKKRVAKQDLSREWLDRNCLIKWCKAENDCDYFNSIENIYDKWKCKDYTIEVTK